MSKKKSPRLGGKSITVNKKARFEYFIEQRFEAGLSLTGWEVKGLRDGRAHLNESYVVISKDELWLFGSHIAAPSHSASHINTDPIRTRKLLMHRREIDRLIGYIQRKGYTCVPLSLYWSKGKVKAEIALAKGKKDYDKRATQKDRDWKRQKQRILKEQ